MNGSVTAIDARSAPLPPRARGRPLVGLLPAWRKGPLPILDDLHARYGDVVRIPMGLDITLFAHPDGVRHILQDNQANYRKGFDYDRLVPFVGRGLLTSEGDVWRRHRRLAQPAFHKQRVQGWGQLMLSRTDAMLARWRALPPGATLDVHHEMMRLTLEVVGEALFSEEMGPFVDEVGPAVGHAIRMADQRVNSIIAWPEWVPTPFNRRMHQHVGTLDRVVDAIIAKRRGAPPTDDLLGLLMQASDGGEGPPLSARELRDEVMTLIIVGHETTANALTFALLLLSENPAARAELVRQIDARAPGRAVTAADAGSLGYARQVAEEAMRLYPPAWTISRQCVEDDVVCGHRVKAGMLVMVAPWVTQRDARFWPDPLRFDPERFTPERVAERPRMTYFPFGAGPRMCIGKSFAMMELELILARLAQAVEVQVELPGPLELEPTITLRPRGAVPARCTWKQAG